METVQKLMHQRGTSEEEPMLSSSKTDHEFCPKADEAAKDFFHRLQTQRPLYPKVFISYSHQDRDFAQRLSKTLKMAGVPLWIDTEEIRIGDSLIEKIREGIDRAEYVIAIISRSSVNSEWVRKELDIAMNQEIERKKVKVLPVLLEKCDLPGFLKGKLYADFTVEENYYAECEKIISAKNHKSNAILRYKQKKSKIQK